MTHSAVCPRAARSLFLPRGSGSWPYAGGGVGPKVRAGARGGRLRLFTSETVARKLPKGMHLVCYQYPCSATLA